MPTPSRKMIDLLQQLIEGQEQQNHLLKFIADSLSITRRERATILVAWTKANPLLSAACREAIETLGKVYNAVLTDLTEVIVKQSEELMESDFSRQEFIDRFAPRIEHLSALATILQQHCGPANPPATARESRRTK